MSDVKFAGGIRSTNQHLEAGGAAPSVTDRDGAYLDFDAGTARARAGAKGAAGTSRGFVLRTVNAGVPVDAFPLAPDGSLDVATATDADATAADFVVAQLGGAFRRFGLSSVSKWLNARRGAYNLVDGGAKCDGKKVTDGAVTNGSAVLNSATAGFTAADVGKTVRVSGAAGGGVDLVTTIQAYTDAQHVTMAAAASATLSACTVYWGTDDTAALQAMLNAGAGRFEVPSGAITLARKLTFQSLQAIVATSGGAQQVAGQATLVFIGAAGAPLAPLNAATTDTKNVRIQDLAVDGGSLADTCIDFTRVSYSVLEDVYASGVKTGAVGLRFDAKVSGQCYFNHVRNCKADVSNGVDVAFDNGANVNVVVGGKFGNAQTGMRFTNATAGVVVLGSDFETNAVQHVSIDSTSTRNEFYGIHMEDAPIGFNNAANYTVVKGGSIASSVTTPIQDTSGKMILQLVDPTETCYLGVGYLQFKQTNFSTATTLTIDPKTVNGTADALVRWFRNVATTGKRQILLHAGDGSGTVNVTLDAGTGAITVSSSLNVSGNAGTSRTMKFQTGGVDRWSWQATSDAETGANAGSNLNLLSRKDDGTALNTIVHVDRASGLIKICQDVGTKIQIGASGTSVAVVAFGTLTLGAAATTTVNNAAVTGASRILLWPTNAAASALRRTHGLYVSAKTAGTSFALTTDDGTAAAGTEAFDYLIIG